MQTTNKGYLDQIRIAKRNYYLFLAVTLLIPILMFAFLATRIISLDRSLIKIEATIANFNIGNGGKGRPQYCFKVVGYPASFSRVYQGIFKSSPKDRIEAIYGHMPIFTDTTRVPVSFYIAAEDRARLNLAKEEVTWYYLSPKTPIDSGKKGFYWDLYLHVSQSDLFFNLLTFACLLNVLTCIMAFYWSTQVPLVNAKSSYFIIAVVLLGLVYIFMTL